MKLVKKIAKYLVVGLVLLSFVKPLSIPKLPPVQQIANAVTTVNFS